MVVESSSAGWRINLSGFAVDAYRATRRPSRPTAPGMLIPISLPSLPVGLSVPHAYLGADAGLELFARPAGVDGHLQHIH